MKKLCSIVLIACLLMFSIISPVWAVDNNAEEVPLELTYEKAYEMALENSKDIKNAEADIERSEIIKDEASKYVYFIPTKYSNLSPSNLGVRNVYLGATKSQIGYQMSKKSVDLTKDKLYYSVIKAYNDVLDSIEGKNLAEKNLEIAKKELEIVKAKYKYGMASEIDKITATQSVVEEEENLKVAVATLNDSYQQLNLLLGLKAEERPNLTESITYDKLEMDKDDIDVLITRIKSDSIPVWLQEQYVKLAQQDLDLYISTAGGDPYDAKEIDLEKSKTDLASTKESLEKSIYTIYNSIQKLESSIEMMNALMVKAQEGARIAEVQYGLGMVTELDVLKSKQSVIELEKKIFETKVQHQELVAALYKPWVASA